MARIALILFTLIPTILAQCSIETTRPLFSRAVYEFSIDLLARLAVDTEYHFVASTLSPWTLLAHASLGASGNTLNELEATLRLNLQTCYKRKSFDIAKEIYKPTQLQSLRGASAIIIDERYDVKKSFINKVQKAGISDIKTVSLANTDEVAYTINDYIKTVLEGYIDDMVQASDFENIVMMIIDVLHFKGDWMIPFPVEYTSEEAFYDEKKNKIGKVNLMTLTDNFLFKSIDEINSTVVELPYTDKRFSMLIFRPYEDEKLSNLIYALKTISLRAIFQLFAASIPDEILLQVPRFKITSDLNNLKELLVDMGLTSMFNNEAEFPGISERGLYVSNIVQKAVVEVNERGTTASAATEMKISFKSLPYEIKLNKPFLYMIVDKENTVPVFIGTYSKPSLF